MPAKVYRRTLIVAFATATLLSAGPLTGSGAAQAQQAGSVIIKNFDFAPMSLTVKAGASVTWKNLDGEPHTVTSADGFFRSGAIDQNESFVFKFDKPGTYKYVCSIHPKMMATIVVQ